MTNFDQVTEAAAFLKSRLGHLTPRIGVVLGSGLGSVADAIPDPTIISYADIPHFPQSTVEGHSGRIVAGLLTGIPSNRASELWCRTGVPVVVMQGRVHSYEGYSAAQVTFPMRVLGALGLRAVVLTNAAGGMTEGYRIGQLVALSDHINFMGFNPLAGPNEPRFGFRPGSGRGSGTGSPASGLRFTDMTEAYSRRLRALAQDAAQAEGFQLPEGVYLAVPGPSFETPAEIRAFRALGATLVGMSTVPETIVARHMGVEVLGISCVTNLAAGLGETKLSHTEVFEAGRKAEKQFIRLFNRLFPVLAALLEPER